MKIIITKNTQNDKFMPMLTLINDTEETKKAIKKQLIEQIINAPETLKAYKGLEIYTCGNVDEDMEITVEPKTKLYSYKELLEEIIKELTEEKDV